MNEKVTIEVEVPTSWKIQELREVVQVTEQLMNGPSLPTRAIEAIADGLEEAEKSKGEG